MESNKHLWGKPIPVVRRKKSRGIMASCAILLTAYCPHLFAEQAQGTLFNIGVSTLHDDNIFNQSTPISDNLINVTPEIASINHFGKHHFSLGYSGDYAAYADHDTLNYANHELGTELFFDHTQRFSSKFGLKHQQSNEEPGTTNASTNQLSDFIFYDQDDATVELSYGTRQSIGQLVANYQYSRKRYDDSLQRYRDVDRNAFTGTFYYRIAPKTRILLEAARHDYDYVEHIQFSDQSNITDQYLGGIDWDLANKTTGIFKIGYQHKDYSEDYFESTSSLYYSLDMIWRPNTYSKVTLTSGRENTESAVVGSDGYITKFYAVQLDHEFTRRTSIGIKYQYDTEDSASIGNNIRHDFKLNLTYSLLRWLDVSLEYGYLERDSDFDQLEYKSNILALSLQTRFE